MSSGDERRSNAHFAVEKPPHLRHELDGLLAKLSHAGVPQLIALLAHVPTQNPCSEAFGLVRISKRHRYTFRVEVLAN